MDVTKLDKVRWVLEQRVGKRFLDVWQRERHHGVEDGYWFCCRFRERFRLTFCTSCIDYLQVSKLMFPLGRLMKNEVRDIAPVDSQPSGHLLSGKIDYNDFCAPFPWRKGRDIVELEAGRKLSASLLGFIPSASVRDWGWRTVFVVLRWRGECDLRVLADVIRHCNTV